MFNNDVKGPPGQEITENSEPPHRLFGTGRQWKGNQRNNAITMLHKGLSAEQVAEILLVPIEKVIRLVARPYLPIGWRRSRQDMDRKT
jgi:hypothetical protein